MDSPDQPAKSRGRPKLLERKRDARVVVLLTAGELADVTRAAHSLGSEPRLLARRHLLSLAAGSEDAHPRQSTDRADSPQAKAT